MYSYHKLIFEYEEPKTAQNKNVIQKEITFFWNVHCQFLYTALSFLHLYWFCLTFDINSLRINCVYYSLGFTDLKTSRDKNLMAKLCAQKEAVLLHLHMNPPLSIVCSLPYSPPTSQLKTSIIYSSTDKNTAIFFQGKTHCFPKLHQLQTLLGEFPAYPSYTTTMNATHSLPAVWSVLSATIYLV